MMSDMKRLPFVLLFLAVGCGPSGATNNSIAAAPPADLRAAGTWRAQDMVIGTQELLLARDGTFRYTESGGAADGHGSGRWTSDGHRVTLTSNPHAPLAFTPGPVMRNSEGLSVSVLDARTGETIQGIEVTIGLDDGSEAGGITISDGYHYSTESRPRWIRLRDVDHHVTSAQFPVNPAAGNAFVFRYNADEIPVIDFIGMSLELDGDRLVLHDGERIITFSRAP